MTETRHYARDRRYRESIIRTIGNGHIIKVVVLDRGHRNGPEIHKISDTGIISIYNLNSGKLITRLIARPNQIRRYFENGDAPIEVLRIAREHQRLHYNMAQVEGFFPQPDTKRKGDKTMLGKTITYAMDKLVVNGEWHINEEHPNNELILYRWYGEAYAELHLFHLNGIITKTYVCYAQKRR